MNATLTAALERTARSRRTARRATPDAGTVVGYLRVSTDEQVESGAGMDAQRTAIEKAATAKGWTITEWFSDEGLSGGKAPSERPGLAAALEAVQTGQAERLVVEGTVESQMIHAHELNISGTGVFKGEVEVENAEVAGVFDGTITARGNLVIRATGRVLGVARCRRLQVEDGGQLSGRMEMLTDNNPPRMGVPAFPSAEPAEV